MIEREIEIVQGQNLSFNIIVTSETTNTAANITNYTDFTGRLKRSYITDDIAANLTITKVDSANGRVVASLGYTETDSLDAINYVFNVSCVTNTNEKIYIAKGLIIVQPKV